MWGGRQIRIPFPPKRTDWLRFDTGRYRKRRKPDPNAPNLAGIPRSTVIRREVRRESMIYGSPIRWILFVAAGLAAFVGIAAPNRYGVLVNLASLAAVAASFHAAFGLQRRTRLLFSSGLILVGLAHHQGGRSALPGTILLAAGAGLHLLAYWGPRSDWVRRVSRGWIREHARRVGNQAPNARLAARQRSREIREQIRSEARRFRSPLRWGMLGVAGVVAVGFMLPATLDGLGFIHFAGMLAVTATAVAAFATAARLRAIGGVLAASAGAACLACGGLGVLGIAVGGLGLVVGFLPDPPA